MVENSLNVTTTATKENCLDNGVGYKTVDNDVILCSKRSSPFLFKSSPTQVSLRDEMIKKRICYLVPQTDGPVTKYVKRIITH